MSAPAVEARSLSSLTALASNPPAYPRNPTHVRHEPLVLYIARVPGSKDVFLSPMKPRQKVVTAEDITSSLYFLHVEQPGDAELITPPNFQERDYRGRDMAKSSTPPMPIVPRKAVPGQSAGAPARKPLPGVLGPIDDYESRQNVTAGIYGPQPSILAPDSNIRSSIDSPRFRGENLNLIASEQRSSERPRVAGTSLTLIRRDPASGAQWNVARIEDPPVSEVSSSTLNESSVKKSKGAPLYIEITNPGYSKFLYSEDMGRPLPQAQPTEASMPRSRAESNVPTSMPASHTRDAESNLESKFRRRLWMEGSQYASSGLGHRKNSSYDINSQRPSSRSSYERRNGSSAFGSNETPSFLSRNDQTYGTIQVADRQTNFRGYVFTSPWNGRCEFITGAGGGSLKCRHVIPGLQGASPAAAFISELRFNLPSISLPTTPRNEEPSKRSSFFHRGRHSRNGSSLCVNKDETSNSINALDRLDLSLGQEFAGGGFGGKEAKLGKIILEDEGLKMMDLLVAANMALWFRAYEKATAPPRDYRGSF